MVIEEETVIKWIARGLTGAASCFTFWFCGLWTFEPRWSPNWKLFGVLVLVSTLSGFGSHMQGWLAGYDKALADERSERERRSRLVGY